MTVLESKKFNDKLFGNLFYEIMQELNLKIIIFILTVLVTVTAAQDTSITKSIIESGERVIGFKFTDSERDSMLENLRSNATKYKVIRDYKLANDIPPAFMFNPLPSGFKFEIKKELPEFEEAVNVEMPVNREDLANYAVTELAFLIKNKKITSTELTELFIERLKRYDPVLHCVITFTEEYALEQAAKADKEIAEGNYRGILHGIPYGAKDLLAKKGYKTTWGSVPYKDQVIDEDAEVIKKLENAGAVLVAKLTMGELAWGDVWFGGMTRNPWDTTKGSSGSSAGSASAVSAGLIPFAIGTETWGSIISPSTVCGTTGLRPTYGRVSRTGAMTLSWTMDKIGAIARSVEDCAIVFNAIYGEDPLDQTLIEAPFNYKQEMDFSKLRVGYLADDFGKEYSFKSNDSMSLSQLREMGINLIPVKLPDIPVGALSFILSTEGAAAFDELTISGKDDELIRQIKNAWPNVFRSARFIPAVEYINAQRIRYLLIQEMSKLFEEVDVIISPSWVGGSMLMTNLTGHPAVVIPNGFIGGGTPSSITFIGNLFREDQILALTKRLQKKTGVHLKRPLL
jgi:Asp-tRNA(Asn)/Glu-tRNA(Gln) amidotransferase A subunit family amidase